MYNGVYPAYIRPYTPIRPKNLQHKSEEDSQKQGSSAERENLQNGGSNSQNVATTSYQLPGYSGFRNQIQTRQPVQQQNPDTKNINVAQIINDFRSTANAVGAPKEITDEVHAYLDLIQTQANKEIPNKKIIQSNLKNASQVLDGYISKTLKTQSNVVENWVDALFLQNIDYKADESVVNEFFKLNFDEKEEKATPSEEETVLKKEVKEQKENLVQEAASHRNYIPQDEKMRKLFVNAKQNINGKDTKTALISLKKALDYAQETNDEKMQSMIYFETADLYNKNGHFAQALKGYKLAADLATDENLIAKSYMKTGKIYNEAGLIEPAKNHWFSAIGYAGESENLTLQVKALNNLAEIQSEIYDKKSAYTFSDIANNLAEETNDNRVKGYSYKKSSQISELFNDKPQALQYLKLSTKSYSKVNDTKNLIENYISASDIMVDVGNSKKARTLLDKAYLAAVDCGNKEILNKITTRMAELAA